MPGLDGGKLAHRQIPPPSSAATLGEIGKLGSRLEHPSYYFMITGETSTNRAFVSGQATAVSGITVGVYLFRNAGLPELTT